METTKKLKEIAENGIDFLQKKLQSAYVLKMIVFGLMILVFITIIIWLVNVFSLQNSNCKLLETVYKNEKISTINSITESDEFNKPLLDFYIKTAYNAASAGNFKNSFVDSSITDPQYCALRTCIQQGARCLDFEIYSVDDEPVISTSLLDSVNIKQTFNFLKFSEAMQFISQNAFNVTMCPGPDDPLFINLRIMSARQNNPIYPKIASALLSNFNERLLGKEHNLLTSCSNLGLQKLSSLRKKVIIIIDDSTFKFLQQMCPSNGVQNCTSETDPIPATQESAAEKLDDSKENQCQSPNLAEIVNMHSGSPYIHTYRLSEFKLQDTSIISQSNKFMMTILLPDFNQNAINFNPALGFSSGCQMVGISFQNFDTNMEFYSLFFDRAGYSFVYKPANLRNIPIISKAPPLPPPGTSVHPKEVILPTGDGKSINIFDGEFPQPVK